MNLGVVRSKVERAPKAGLGRIQPALIEPHAGEAVMRLGQRRVQRQGLAQRRFRPRQIALPTAQDAKEAVQRGVAGIAGEGRANRLLRRRVVSLPLLRHGEIDARVAEIGAKRQRAAAGLLGLARAAEPQQHAATIAGRFGVIGP